MKYFPTHHDYILHLAVYLAMGRSSGNLLQARESDVKEALQALKSIGVRLPGDPELRKGAVG
jgi:hypothetical protein